MDQQGIAKLPEPQKHVVYDGLSVLAPIGLRYLQQYSTVERARRVSATDILVNTW
jgi:hypothetical protein